MNTRPDCQHDLQAHSNVLLADGRNFLVVFCGKCDRQWNCEPINFAPMGQPPRYTTTPID